MTTETAQINPTDKVAASDTFKGIIEACRTFVSPLPCSEIGREAGLRDLIERIGERIRGGALNFDPLPSDSPRIVRLAKEKVGQGRLKLQLFAFEKGESHPPHAHHDLLSCQIVLRGKARVTEFDLRQHLSDDLIEIDGETIHMLTPGEGVFTLARRNNIHWQEGLTDDTLLLNINWQGFLTPDEGFDNGPSGRRGLSWKRRRPGARAGSYLVPVTAM